MRVLVVNGPNLNTLGKREPEIYGSKSMDEVLEELKSVAGAETDYFQSNAEGAIIDRLQHEDFDALIINPGAYTHYSLAIADALRALNVPKVEVHISNIYRREAFRQVSVTASCCDAVLSGFGTAGYYMALQYLAEKAKG